jgi:hypothetical protein
VYGYSLLESLRKKDVLNIEGGGVGVTQGEGGRGGFEVAVGQQAGRQLESPPTCPASPRQGGRQGECRRDHNKGLRGLLKNFPVLATKHVLT